MQSPVNKSLTLQELFSSRLLRVRGYTCSAPRSGPSVEEQPDGHNIVLIQRGVFGQHVGRECVTADVNTAVFFSDGTAHQISHPTDLGNSGTVITLSGEVLRDITCGLDPYTADLPSLRFPFMGGPCPADAFVQHRELVTSLHASQAGTPDTMWVEETVISLAARVISASIELRSRVYRRRRPATAADHKERSEAVKSYLSRNLGKQIKLDDVARAVHASPFNLARFFKEQTGSTVHRYLTQLRMRTAMERLAGGDQDLTGLALDLGYASHSHFTDTFRREFGLAPSVVRDSLCSARPV